MITCKTVPGHLVFKGFSAVIVNHISVVEMHSYFCRETTIENNQFF